VWRDRLMTQLAERYPGYGLEKHAGYPTPAHKAAIIRLGPSRIHRRTFAGVCVPLSSDSLDGVHTRSRAMNAE
jgi:ribonuclease HII